mgnify:CR=1|jgi:hypothetical protein
MYDRANSSKASSYSCLKEKFTLPQTGKHEDTSQSINELADTESTYRTHKYKRAHERCMNFYTYVSWYFHPRMLLHTLKSS